MAATHTRKKLSTKDKAVAATAGVLCTALLAGSALANTVYTPLPDITEGVLLHNDCDNTPDDYDADGNPIFNHDVYVENIGDTPLIVRVRFDEEFQINDTVVVGHSAVDKTLWDTLEFPAATTIAADGLVQNHRGQTDPILPYYQWYMTGDWKHYKPGDIIQDDKIYIHNQRFNEYTIALHTLETAKIITMATYTQNPVLYTGPDVVGRWVLDKDGWAYWSQALTAGTATNLLLDSVKGLGKIGEATYYNINAVLQATDTTKEEAGRFISMGNTATPEGKALIERIVGDAIEPYKPEEPEGFKFGYGTFVIPPDETLDIVATINGEPITNEENYGITFTMEEDESATPIDELLFIDGITVTSTADAVPGTTFTIWAHFENTAWADEYADGIPLPGLVTAPVEDLNGPGVYLTRVIDQNGDGMLSEYEYSLVDTLDLSQLTEEDLASESIMAGLEHGIGYVWPRIPTLSGLNLGHLDATLPVVEPVIQSLIVELSGGDGENFEYLDLSDTIGLGGRQNLLSKLPNIAELNLAGSDFTDTELIATLTNLTDAGKLLKTLNLSNSINLATPNLLNLSGLINLDVSGSTGITCLDLSGLTSLENLNLSNMGLSGVLSSDQDTGELVIDPDTVITNVLPGLKTLKNLKSLNLSNNSGLTQIVLNGILPHLTSLNASNLDNIGVIIANNEELTNMNLLGSTSLQGLVLSGSGITNLSDISALNSLKSLQILSIDNTKITGPLDFTAMEGLTSLNVSNLKNITGLELTGLVNLTRLGIEGITEIVPNAFGLFGSGLLKPPDELEAAFRRLNQQPVMPYLTEFITAPDVSISGLTQDISEMIVGGILCSGYGKYGAEVDSSIEFIISFYFNIFL